MIEVENLSKSYGQHLAVSSLSFSAKKGEIVGFLGPNGAGKTTTLRVLTTYLPPSSGTAQVGGYDINSQSDQVRKCLGYLPETPPLYKELSVEEYLYFVARIKGIAGKQIKEKVEQVIEKCFLHEVHKRLCGHLSKGFKQRVGIAQAIVHEPDVIILDEPTSGLDPRQIIDIRKLISSLADKHTVLLSTHILPEVSMLCSKVVIINNGQIALEKELSDLEPSSLEEVFVQCVGKRQDVYDEDFV